MSLTKRLGLIVGAAASLNSAMAQTALDQSRAYQNELFSDARERVNQRAATAFTPTLGGYMQIRYNYNQRDDNLDDDATNGFQNARTRINLKGNVFNEDWGYFVQFGWSDDTSVGAPTFVGTSYSATSVPGPAGGFNLEDAFATYKMGNGWDMKAGQFKLPFMREELVGDTNQLAMDRSLTNATFTQGRSQGLQFGYSADNFRINVALSDGLRSANTDIDSPVEADLAFTGRGEYMWAGAWNQADDFTSWQNSSFFGMVGAAGHYQMAGGTYNSAATAAGTPLVVSDPADLDLWGLTADVTVKGNGWNAFAAAVFTNTDPGDDSVGTIGYPGSGTPGGGTAPSVTDMAFMVQGGIFVAPQWELYGRMDYIVPDSDRTPPGGPTLDSEMMAFAFGVNYYISPDSQAAKFTAQLLYLVDEQNQGIVAPSTLTGFLGSNDSQFTLSAQLQLGF